MRSSTPVSLFSSCWRRCVRLDSNERGLWFLLLAGGVLCLFALGRQRTLGTHEAFVAVPARQMLESGDWLVPQFAGKPRLQKPPLAYWLVAGLGILAGGIDEFVARLPSAASTWLLALLVGRTAWRWWGPQAGLAAVLMQFSAAWVLTYGRRAEPDMLLTLLGTIVWVVFARLIADGARCNIASATSRRLWTLLLVALAAGWLIKFHYTLALFVASLAVFVVWERRVDWLRGVMTPWGWGLFMAAILVWPLAVWWHVPEAAEVWYRETIGRARGTLGSDPWWDYLPKVLVMPAPWTPWVIIGLWRLFEVAQRGDRTARWLLASVVGQFLLITLQPSKHPNYALGIMPLLTLAAADPLGGHLAWLWHLRRRLPVWGGVGLATIAALAIASGTWAGANRWPHLAQEMVALAAIGGCGIAVATAFGLSGRHDYGLSTLGLCFLTLCCAVHAIVLPRLDRRRADAEFGRAVRKQVGQRQTVWLYRLNQTPEALDPVAFYVGSPVVRLDGPCEVEERLSAESEMATVCYESDLDELGTLGRVEHVMTMRPDPFVSPPHPPFVLVRLKRPVPTGGGSREPGSTPASDPLGGAPNARWAAQPDARSYR